MFPDLNRKKQVKTWSSEGFLFLQPSVKISFRIFFTKKKEIRNLSRINVFHVTILERQEMVSKSLKCFDTKDDWGVIKAPEG